MRQVLIIVQKFVYDRGRILNAAILSAALFLLSFIMTEMGRFVLKRLKSLTKQSDLARPKNAKAYALSQNFKIDLFVLHGLQYTS